MTQSPKTSKKPLTSSLRIVLWTAKFPQMRTEVRKKQQRARLQICRNECNYDQPVPQMNSSQFKIGTSRRFHFIVGHKVRTHPICLRHEFCNRLSLLIRVAVGGVKNFKNQRFAEHAVWLKTLRIFEITNKPFIVNARQNKQKRKNKSRSATNFCSQFTKFVRIKNSLKLLTGSLMNKNGITKSTKHA